MARRPVGILSPEFFASDRNIPGIHAANKCQTGKIFMPFAAWSDRRSLRSNACGQLEARLTQNGLQSMETGWHPEASKMVEDFRSGSARKK